MSNPVLHLLIELAHAVKAGNTEPDDLQRMAVQALGEDCQGDSDELIQAYKKAALEHSNSEGNPGDWEIDDNALVSIGDDDGAYVQAWVWIPSDWLKK